MRELINHILEKDIFTGASKEEARKRWEDAPTFTVVYKGDREDPDNYDNFTLDKLYQAKSDPDDESMLILKNDLGQTVSQPGIDFDWSYPCASCGKEVFFENSPEYDVCSRCDQPVCSDCSMEDPSGHGDFMCKSHKDEPVEEASIFKGASSKDLTKRRESAPGANSVVEMKAPEWWMAKYRNIPFKAVEGTDKITYRDLVRIFGKPVDAYNLMKYEFNADDITTVWMGEIDGEGFQIWDYVKDYGNDYNPQRTTEWNVAAKDDETISKVIAYMNSKIRVREAKDIFKGASQKELVKRRKDMPRKVQIRSLEQLKLLAMGDAIDIVITLGMFRSTKRVAYEGKDAKGKDQWWIFNYIDESETSRLEDTNIVKAMKTGNLFLDESVNEEKNIFKGATKKEVEQRVLSSFKQIDISKWKTVDEYLNEMIFSIEHYRIWSGGYVKAPTVWYDTYYLPYEESDGHAFEIISDRKTRKLLAVWDLGQYESAEEAETDLHGFNAGIFLADLKAKGVPIKEADIFKGASKTDLNKRRSEYLNKLIRQGGKNAYYVEIGGWRVKGKDDAHAEARARELLARGRRPSIEQVEQVEEDEKDQYSQDIIEISPVDHTKAAPLTGKEQAYYIDFSSWVVRADSEAMAEDRAEAYMNNTLLNNTVPGICNVEATGDPKDIGESTTLSEAGKKDKNIFKGASQEEFAKRKEEYSQEQLRKAEAWVAIAKQELETALEVQVSITNEEGRWVEMETVEGKGNNDESEWIVFQSSDDAEAVALDRVREDLESDPGTFNQDWLQYYIEVSDTDRRMIAQEDADRYVDEQLQEDEILKEAGVEDDYQALQDQIDELDSDSDNYDTMVDDLEQQKTEMLDEARDTVRERKYDEVYEELGDPIQYFVHDQGIYSIDDLMKAPFISIDIDAAAQAAIDEDGVAHFLDHYDGEEVELPSGAVAYGTN